MTYDLFISYSRRDNQAGQVTSLKAHIEASFRAFAGRDLRVFFDLGEIAGMDDWHERIQQSLRESHLFLAVLSPNYLASPYCRWEWEDYVRYEAMRQCLGEGVAPVFFVTFPDADDPKVDQAIARWIDEIHKRQAFDLRPWHDYGEKALREAHVEATLEQLHASVRERLDRVERAKRSPNNLIKANPAFVGRISELAELRNALAKNKLGIVGPSEGQVLGRATIQGIGGMGKTELALAYAHAFAWDYPGGRWQIPCEHIGDLRLALTRLAGPMGFEFTDDEKKDLDLSFNRVLRELNRRDRYLLILDNVSDSSLLHPEYLDRFPRNGSVDIIATTRLAPGQIPGSAQEQTFVAVDELPDEDALALMRSHKPGGHFANQQEDDEAHAIVRLLGGFTLAVETAAIYLGRQPASDAYYHYRERLQSDLLLESEKTAGHETVALRHRERLLEKTLAFTLETLMPEALHLLTIASLLPADQIATAWIRAIGSERFPAFIDDAQSVFRDQQDMLLGLRLFQSTGVVDAGGQPLVVRMHRLVQELVQRRAGELPHLLKTALTEYARDRGHFSSEAWIQSENRWEVRVLTACAWHWMKEPDDRGPLLANMLVRPLVALYSFGEAESLISEAAARIKENHGENNNLYAASLSNLASVLVRTNRFNEAEAIARQSLRLEESVHGTDSVRVAASANLIGTILAATNRMSEAELFYRRALSLYDANIVTPDAEVAIASSNLADLLASTNRLTEAESFYERALAIYDACYGSEHPELARTIVNLSGLLYKTGRLSRAEPLIRHALVILEKCFGPNHVGIARPLITLAYILASNDRLSEAEEHAQRSLSNLRQNLSPDDPQVAEALVCLASILRRMSRMVEAEQHYRRAASILSTTLGPNHPKVSTVLNNLAGLLRAMHQLEEAESIYRHVLSIDEVCYSPDDPEVAIHLGNLASLLEQTHRLNEAEVLRQRVVPIFLRFARTTGYEHPNHRKAFIDYVNLLANLGVSPSQIATKLALLDEESRSSKQ